VTIFVSFGVEERERKEGGKLKRLFTSTQLLCIYSR
jgi:hypothetical protein